MKRKRLTIPGLWKMAGFMLAFLLAYILPAGAQPRTAPIVSPAGVFDKVFDKDGRSYNLQDLMAFRPRTQTRSSNVTCTSTGYFRVFYEPGWSGNATTTQAANYQNAICMVLSDLSNFLPAPVGSPLATGDAFVNIWVRDITALTPAPPSAVLGLASSFFLLPAAGSAFGGIVENQLQRTIITGNDAFIGVSSPLVSTNSSEPSSAGFYHAMMAFNFTTIQWQADLGLAPNSSQYDLYTVVLHEMLHALGIASLINFDGNSKFGTDYPYYGTFDTFIRNATNTASLITSANTGCSNINPVFNPALNPSITRPGCTSPTPTFAGSANTTACNDALRFVGPSGVNVPLYTPTCFEPPSSLSHFEDLLYPTCAAPEGNDEYFVMSNAQNNGAHKRTPTPEERRVLCDLGYRVNTSYGTSGVLDGTRSYTGGACGSGSVLAGVNDGISSTGAYMYTANAGSTNVVTISGVLDNDLGSPDAIACLEVIFGGGTATVAGTNISYTASTDPGITLLRYVPTKNSGTRWGNITYIYVFNLAANCDPSSCEIVNNSGLEATQCGLNIGTRVNCWYQHASDADNFVRNCTSGPQFTDFNIGVNTWNSNPPVDTYDDGANINNNGFIGVGANFGWFSLPDEKYSESVQTLLSSPLIPNQQYTLSFFARVLVTNSFSAVPSHIQFCSAPGILAAGNGIYPGTLNQLIPSIEVPSDDDWHLYTITFTFDETVNHSNLLIGHNLAPYATDDEFGENYQAYFLLDDVKITPVDQGPSFELPDSICPYGIITSLGQFANPPGGSFSGDGITQSGNQFNFSAATAGLGTHFITYTYVSNLGCTLTTATSITVGECATCATVSITASPTFVCGNPNAMSTLTASGTGNFEWEDGSTQNPRTVTSGGMTKTYSVTVTNNNGCTGSASTTVFYSPNCPCANCTDILPATLSQTPLSNQSYCVQQDMTITGNVGFSDCELRIASGVTITVEPGATLLIIGSHLYSCGDMWDGIVVKNGGRVYIQPSSYGRSTFIEDAIHAIKVEPSTYTSSYILNIRGAIFNRNTVGIQINGFTQSNAATAFDIQDNLFTCRNIPFSTYNFTLNTWPTMAQMKQTLLGDPLQQQYISNITYPPTGTNAFMKAPFAGVKSLIGIHVSKCGTTSNAATTPAFTEVQIGKAGTLSNPNFNLFDELYVGIYSYASNTASINNVFQRTVDNVTGTQLLGFRGGQGIYANGQSLPTGNYRLRVQATGLGGMYKNRFWNCRVGVQSDAYFNNQISGCDIRSSQTLPFPVEPYGKTGIMVTTNVFQNTNIFQNSIYNITGPIDVTANYGSVAVGSTTSPNGQYAGKITIASNTIQPRPAGSTFAGAFVEIAITASESGSGAVLPAQGISPSVNITGNVINGVHRGINCNNWKPGKQLIVSSNTVTLANDAAPNEQYGINYSANTSILTQVQNKLTDNIITGYSIAAGNHPRYTAILTRSSSNIQITCNRTSNTNRGLEFNGTNMSTFIRNNTMGDLITGLHQYGFVLSDLGKAGMPNLTGGVPSNNSIGSAAMAADNIWSGTWSGTNRKTAVLAYSDARQSTMFVHNAANPNGSSTSIPTATANEYSTNGSNTGSLRIVPGLYLFSICPITPTVVDGGGVLNGIVELETVLSGKTEVNLPPITGVTRKLVYDQLAAVPDFVENSGILKQFFNEKSDFRTLQDIQNALAAGNFALAATLNETLDKSDRIMANYNSYFKVYLHIKDTVPDTEDSIQLALLAGGCPFLDGTVVFEARALFNELYHADVVFNDNCPESSARIDNQTAASSEPFAAILYPNPASGDREITIASLGGTATDVLKVEVTDITGKLVHSGQYTLQYHHCQFRLVAQQGVYTVRITNQNTQESVARKLVIQK